MKPVLKFKMFVNNENETFNPKVSVDDVKKYLIDNDIEINDEINVSIKNLTYNQENKFFNNRDYKIEKTKLIELWHIFYPHLPEKIILKLIENFECQYWGNKVYELSCNFEWKKGNLKKLNDLGIFKIIDELRKKDLPKATELINEINWSVNPFTSAGFIPIYWYKNFELIRTNLKSTKSQGENNGPDFIFKDRKTNKIVGVEIAQIKPNQIIIDTKKVKNPEKAMEKWVEGFKKKEGIEGSINEMKRIVKNHTDSIPIYEKCDEYVLILVTNNCFPEYLYQLMEHYLNEETEVDGKRQRAFPKWKWIFVF